MHLLPCFFLALKYVFSLYLRAETDKCTVNLRKTKLRCCLVFIFAHKN